MQRNRLEPTALENCLKLEYWLRAVNLKGGSVDESYLCFSGCDVL